VRWRGPWTGGGLGFELEGGWEVVDGWIGSVDSAVGDVSPAGAGVIAG